MIKCRWDPVNWRNLNPKHMQEKVGMESRRTSSRISSSRSREEGAKITELICNLATEQRGRLPFSWRATASTGCSPGDGRAGHAVWKTRAPLPLARSEKRVTRPSCQIGRCTLGCGTQGNSRGWRGQCGATGPGWDLKPGDYMRSPRGKTHRRKRRGPRDQALGPPNMCRTGFIDVTRKQSVGEISSSLWEN